MFNFTIGEIIGFVMMAPMAIVCFIIAYRQHKQMGFVFTNRWLLSSKKEREEMDERVKSREYKFSRNVFFIVGLSTAVFAAAFLFGVVRWILYTGYALMLIACIYAILQWVSNERYYKTFGQSFFK